MSVLFLEFDGKCVILVQHLMCLWGHIEEVIFQITEAVSVAMMAYLIEWCFSYHSVHIDPSSFSVGVERSACVKRLLTAVGVPGKAGKPEKILCVNHYHVSGFADDGSGVAKRCPRIYLLVFHFLPGDIVPADRSFFNLVHPGDLLFRWNRWKRSFQQFIHLSGKNQIGNWFEFGDDRIILALSRGYICNGESNYDGDFHVVFLSG